MWKLELAVEIISFDVLSKDEKQKWPSKQDKFKALVYISYLPKNITSLRIERA